MAKDPAEQLNRIGHKAELLVTRYSLMKQENKRLRAELAERDAEIMALKGSLEHLRLEVEHLRISSAIAPDTATLADTRAFIANLVREIDACVDDLIRDV
ncbi:MAG: hypothetical protein K2L16_03595 [Muribaculaceae bacterium]|nr:hypothetical protein [Muribaculaceae bacterium]